ncbi:MAG: peptidoglycan editing factor PgeF [Anaerolineae bacterium]|nr:peptidoglycan editing factor PgeF [Anaerolineae bacterium]
MQRLQAGGLVYYQFEMWADAPFRHGIFTRWGGVSAAPWGSLNLGGTVGDAVEAVQENHRRMYAALAVDPGQVCSVWQVHSADTVVAEAPLPGRRWLNRADGMVTQHQDVALAMRFADCVPLLFYDPMQNVLGMAHAGWRGTLSGAQLSTLATMQAAYGSRPQDVQVGIGPSIGPARYQVGEEVVQAARAALGPDCGGTIRRDPADGTAYLDLWEANRQLLQRAGVEMIEIAGICTATHTDEFFSHRAEQGQTGRFGALMAF